jgi:hypothetical protein
MEELIEQANEIQESLGRTYGVPDEVDEADLEAGDLLFVLGGGGFYRFPRPKTRTLKSNTLPPYPYPLPNPHGRT